jgi:hypothetical protein
MMEEVLLTALSDFPVSREKPTQKNRQKVAERIT